jgi:hypothetical protein
VHVRRAIAILSATNNQWPDGASNTAGPEPDCEGVETHEKHNHARQRSDTQQHKRHATRDARGRGCTRPLVVDICLRRDFNEGAALSSHPGTTFAALGRDSRASALAGRSSVDRLVFVAA